jgi:hypothetical protein
MVQRPTQRRKQMAKAPGSLPEVPQGNVPRVRAPRKTFDNARDKALHVGKARMERALASIGALRPLANRKTYELSDENRQKMLSALEAAVSEVKEAFASEAPASGPKFTFG